jgi:hypothetical protein
MMPKRSEHQGSKDRGNGPRSRELDGTRSERKARLLDQMELELEELEAATSWRRAR